MILTMKSTATEDGNTLRSISAYSFLLMLLTIAAFGALTIYIRKRSRDNNHRFNYIIIDEKSDHLSSKHIVKSVEMINSQSYQIDSNNIRYESMKLPKTNV